MFIPRGNGRPHTCCEPCRKEAVASHPVQGPDPAWVTAMRDSLKDEFAPGGPCGDLDATITVGDHGHETVLFDGPDAA